ncbi:NAD-dependent epimerase/dehydratase family protein [Rhodopirellula sp. MGV]|uniref:NAD-dependent epimerase/dehydratase family protein n=1 Tax=Rhodopirellula sp. MGV TaxID=2023130 RepID=UPI000B967994|nr:NAD-dependent epimerase/dehydratase family protein [Rhodopirellula sp. MGV]OYP39169.1 CDP-tyvelose epimerase [Rhodopirellula sp. MGV]PNY35454.1 CDP-tyvelose epimerase [Rhodopirellula baltica]
MALDILITGICGFVGSEIALALRQHFASNDLRIRGLDNYSRRGSWRNCERLEHAGIEVVHADIRCTSDVESIGPVDWVIDAAANPSVLAGIDSKSGSRQLLESNLAGTVNLLEHCKNHKAGLILLSTSRVYSIDPLTKLPVEVATDKFRPSTNDFPIGVSDSGIQETFSTAPPVSLYGATKLASEQLALEYGYTFDFPVWINRCGVMAGAGQFGKADQGIFAYWLHSWKEGRSLRYIGFDGQGHQVRDCLHPRDLSLLLIRQLETSPADQPRVVNVSGGIESARSLKQLSDWCEERWGSNEVLADTTPRPFDLPWVVLDHSLATQTWGWNPTTPVESIIEEIAVFAEANPNWISISR